MLKFFQIPLMCSTKLLFNKLVTFWDQDSECFIIQGEQIEIMLLNVYFLTGFPMLGVSSDTTSKLTHGVSLDDLFNRNFCASASVHLSYILVCTLRVFRIEL